MSAASSLASINPLELPDIQAEPPAVPIALDEAGVSDLRYPICVQLVDGSRHHTIATVSFAASVAADVRGVHMSRFIEILHAWRKRLSVASMATLLCELRERLGADSVVAKFEFPLFLERSAPVTGSVGFVPYDCLLEARLDGDVMTRNITTRVPVKSLCPCSREISDYGAHNQRGIVEIAVELSGDGAGVDFEQLIGVAERAGSAQIFSVLKRPDERYITMQAYENPAFVEDITRNVADELRKVSAIRSGRVRVINEESIHSHNAYASVAWSR